MALFVMAFATGPTLAQADDANKILKAMSEYLRSQKNLSASFETNIEVITPQVEKIQFAKWIDANICFPRLTFSMMAPGSTVQMKGLAASLVSRRNYGSGTQQATTVSEHLDAAALG
jgi:hypothetical protein